MAAEAGQGSVLELPYQADDAPRMLYQTVHERPIFSGYISREPPKTFLERAPVLSDLMRPSDAPEIVRVDSPLGVLAAYGVTAIVIYRPPYYRPEAVDGPPPNEALMRQRVQQLLRAAGPDWEDETGALYRVPAAAPTPVVALGEGWHAVEPWAGGRMRWMTAEGSLRLDRSPDRPVTLTFTAWSFGRPRGVAVLIGDRPLTTLTVSPDPKPYAIELPPGASPALIELRATDGADTPASLGLGAGSARPLDRGGRSAGRGWRPPGRVTRLERLTSGRCHPLFVLQGDRRRTDKPTSGTGRCQPGRLPGVRLKTCMATGADGFGRRPRLAQSCDALSAAAARRYTGGAGRPRRHCHTVIVEELGHGSRRVDTRAGRHPNPGRRDQRLAVIGAGTLGWQIACLGRRAASRWPSRCSRGRRFGAARGPSRRSWRSWPIAAAEEPAALADVDHHRPALAARHGRLRHRVGPRVGPAEAHVFAALDQVRRRNILATNSSSFRSRLVADATERPDRVLNFHFLNFPWQRPYIEIMTSGQTSAASLATAAGLGRRLVWPPVVLQGEVTGFLYGRIWRAVKREAIAQLERGIATPEEIDLACQIGMNMPDGPLRMMDRIGLDVILAIEEHYAAETGDPRDAPPAVLRDGRRRSPGPQDRPRLL